MAIKTKGAIMRSKTKWYSDGERCSKYLFGLEKARYNNKVMSGIRLSTGQISHDPKVILDEQHKCYKKLHSADKDVNFEYVNESSPKLSVTERQELESEFTIEELGEALRQTRHPVVMEFRRIFIKYFGARLKMNFTRLSYRHIKMGTFSSQQRKALLL